MKIEENKLNLMSVVTAIIATLALIGGLLVWVISQTGRLDHKEGFDAGQKVWIEEWLKEREARLKLLEDQATKYHHLHEK